MAMSLHQFLCLTDNYGVLLHDSATGGDRLDRRAQGGAHPRLPDRQGGGQTRRRPKRSGVFAALETLQLLAGFMLDPRDSLRPLVKPVDLRLRPVREQDAHAPSLSLLHRDRFESHFGLGGLHGGTMRRLPPDFQREILPATTGCAIAHIGSEAKKWKECYFLGEDEEAEIEYATMEMELR